MRPISAFLKDIGRTNILPITASIAERSGKLRAQLTNAGIIVGQYDLLIAATALTHQHTLITANTKDFRSIPDLQIENWRT